MNAKTTFFLGLSGFFSIFTCVFAQPATTDASASSTQELVRVPQETEESLSNHKKNLARRHMGSTAYAIGEDGEVLSLDEGGVGSNLAAALLGDDEAEEVSLEEGSSQIIVELFDAVDVNRFHLRSFSAAGKITIRGSDVARSGDDPEWKTLLDAVEFSRDGSSEFNFPATTSRFLLVELETTVPGTVGAFGFFGDGNLTQSKPSFLEDPSMIERELEAGAPAVPFDFASLDTNSSIIAVGSGNASTASQLIDDDVTTAHEFDGSESEHAIVIDLGYDYAVNRLSLVMETSPGTLEVFAVPALGDAFAVEGEGTETAYGEGFAITVDEEFFNGMTPVFVRFFGKDEERAQLSFEEVKSRYIIMRWLGIEATIARYPETEPELRQWQAEESRLIEGVLAGELPRESVEEWILMREDPTQVLSGIFRVYEISLIGDVPEELAFLDFATTTEFAPQGPEFATPDGDDGSQSTPDPEPDPAPELPPNSP